MNRKSSRLLAYIFVCISLLYTGIQVSAEGVERLIVKGTSLVNGKGEEVVLKGVSFGWHNW